MWKRLRVVRLSLVNLLFTCSDIILDPSFTVSATRRILHVVNSDDENDEDVDLDEQPTPQPTRASAASDSEETEDEDDFEQAEDDASDLQHLHASQVGATLQQEVK
jgi:hypothetical protein